MPTNPEKIQELQASAKQLAQQALETAELGIRLVRNQFEGAVTNAPEAAEVQKTLQNTAFTVENKAKEMFTLATHFMQELNDKWQPQAPAPGQKGPEAEKPKAEKINIDLD
jgi:hypothetical protein